MIFFKQRKLFPCEPVHQDRTLRMFWLKGCEWGIEVVRVREKDWVKRQLRSIFSCFERAVLYHPPNEVV